MAGVSSFVPGEILTRARVPSRPEPQSMGLPQAIGVNFSASCGVSDRVGLRGGRKTHGGSELPTPVTLIPHPERYPPCPQSPVRKGVLSCGQMLDQEEKAKALTKCEAGRLKSQHCRSRNVESGNMDSGSGVCTSDYRFETLSLKMSEAKYLGNRLDSTLGNQLSLPHQIVTQLSV